MTKAEAWVLHAGPLPTSEPAPPAELVREEFDVGTLRDDEVLARPIYGCWEGNMYHAVARSPVDVCHQRKEPRVVVGNAGVVQVLETGSAVTKARAGDLCIAFPNAVSDRHGYMLKAYAYDAVGTVGLMAKQTRMPEQTVVPIPARTRYTLRQWAAFSARYVTAWSNWNVAYGCWRTQLTPEDQPHPIVWGWGGGVSLAELTLAAYSGARTAMLASSDVRLDVIRRHGIEPIDRRDFDGLVFDEARYASDRAYADRYRAAERSFLEVVRARTDGEGVSIFIDNLGTPVYRATLKALARQGVITTCGWKHGMMLTSVRAIEAIARRIHVNTHFARYSEGLAAVAFAEERGWLPPDEPEAVYAWDRVPALARDYARDRVDSYFPLFQVNPEPG